MSVSIARFVSGDTTRAESIILANPIRDKRSVSQIQNKLVRFPHFQWSQSVSAAHFLFGSFLAFVTTQTLAAASSSSKDAN